MTTDVTDILRQRIISQLQNQPPDDQYIPDATGSSTNDNFLTTVLSAVGTAANLAQILGSLPNNVTEGDIWNAVANDPKVQTAINAGDAIGGVAAATGVAATTVGTPIGGAIVLFVSLVIGIVTSLITGNNANDSSLKELHDTVVDIYNYNVYLAWRQATDDMWNKVGSVYQDLFYLKIKWLPKPPPANDPEGTLGCNPDPMLKKSIDSYSFQQDVDALVQTYIVLDTPWYAPYNPNIIFKPGTYYVPYAEFNSAGWWPNDNPPQTPLKNIPGGGETVLAPMFALKGWLYAIQSWITIYSSAIRINPVPAPPDYPHQQDTFAEILIQYNTPILQDNGEIKGTLEYWGDFILGKYTEAIQGIVKSDLPTNFEVESYYDAVSYVPSDILDPPPPPYLTSWNLVYGVIDLYAEFQQPVTPPSTAPSHIIDSFINRLQTGDPSGELGPVWQMRSELVRVSVLLGLMARWKTIYLLLGYDKVWSILQHLRALANRLPDNEPLLPDGTKANGNWSIREIYDTILTVSPNLSPPGLSVPSLSYLIALFDWIATYPSMPTGEMPPMTRPVSFRDSLTNAAL